MEFRPCIDIHNGSVKQIVGSSLSDQGDTAQENYVSGQDAAFYAGLYREYNITNGHIIMLNPITSPYYEATKKQALSALYAYPGGLQVGGGITPENAGEFLSAGASHVIVTSYVFKNGQIRYDHIENMVREVGRERLVLDLSARKKENRYFIVTDRWQKYTDVELTVRTLDELSDYCDEFLVHAVDVEGKAEGIEKELARLLGDWGKLPVTYAGGVHRMEDLRLLKSIGRDRVNVTVGSALDLFGGSMKFEEVLQECRGSSYTIKKPAE
ncbi:MAG: phosphoribosylformimino-5-aminoimidazole carboxamide ribotide isomerase [Lachnospiraceae bacterium]|nr:phosphoribosylformimino-5-aminoimidazole carboxamide ribotide isomerase [Lachnospiraceae bacterium]